MSVGRIRTEERHRSYTDLIDSIAITAEDDDVAYRRIRVRVDEIRRWFAERTGWPTVVTREMVRLVKTPATADVSQGFAWAQSPLDYELFVWVLWYEEVLESHQFVCSELVQEIEAQVADTAGSDRFSWDAYQHRLALERVMRALASMGAIRKIDGSISEYVRGDAEDALYEFTGVARHLYVHLPRGLEDSLEHGNLSGLARASEATTPQQRLYRALILKPALYRHHDPEAFELLHGRDVLARITEDLRKHLGWDLEVTGSYACLLRPAVPGRSSASFPRRNAAILHVVLLVCLRIRELAQTGEITPDGLDRLRMSRARFTAELLHLRDRFGENWGKGLSAERTAIDSLLEQTLAQMREWGLLEDGDEPDMLRFLPLSARFFGVYTDEPIADFEDEEDEEA